jgi:hypothetical protein
MTNWHDKELNPTGIKHIGDQPKQQVQVLCTADVLGHFKDQAGNAFVCISIASIQKKHFATDTLGAFQLTENGNYKPVTDSTRHVIINQTRESL